MELLLIPGSLRQGSFNRKLLNVANAILSSMPECKTTLADLQTLAFPVYDGDIEAKGIPQSVQELGAMITKANALVIASPEYNAGIAGSLKNTIDWVSRLRPIPFERKPVFLMGATMGAFGTVRALAFTRPSFDLLGAYVYPGVFALPKAAEAFTAAGEFADPSNAQRLAQLLLGYIEFARKLS